MESGYDSETVARFLNEVELERSTPRVSDRDPNEPLTASDIAAIWWSIFVPPFAFQYSPFFTADSIDIRETIMAIATAVGGPKNLPAPMDELWGSMGVEQWELRRLGQLRSWHAAARMTDSMSGGEVPNVWPHPTGPRQVANSRDLEFDSADPLFPGSGATDDNQDQPK